MEQLRSGGRHPPTRGRSETYAPRNCQLAMRPPEQKTRSGKHGAKASVLFLVRTKLPILNGSRSSGAPLLCSSASTVCNHFKCRSVEAAHSGSPNSWSPTFRRDTDYLLPKRATSPVQFSGTDSKQEHNLEGIGCIQEHATHAPRLARPDIGLL